MKRYIYTAVLIGLALLLGSCLEGPWDTSRPVPWLCSINADGTGFRMIKSVDEHFGTTGFWDIYMTKDNRIIFYGEKLWISETDTINPLQLTPDSLLTGSPYRLSQSYDATKLFFAANKNIYQLEYPSYHLTRLTNASSDYLRNPIISSAGNILTFTTYTQLKNQRDYREVVSYLDLESMELNSLPELGSYNSNVTYNADDGLLYYEGYHGLFKAELDGTNITQIGQGSSPSSHRFGLTSDQRYLIRARECLTITDLITGNDTHIETSNDYSGNTLYALCMFVNYVFYSTNSSDIFLYDIDSGSTFPVLQQIPGYAVSKVFMLAPTWDGSKVYFYCEIERSRD